jgi:hypothetical protein
MGHIPLLVLRTPEIPVQNSFESFLVYKKGVGAVLLPILRAQAFALPHLHRIDNAVSPRQNGLYIIRYIETLHVDVSVVICLQ